MRSPARPKVKCSFADRKDLIYTINYMPYMYSPSSSPSPTASTSTLSVEPPDRILILYASETGNAQDVAERVGREFRRFGRRCTVMSMELFDVLELPHVPLLILITSTHGRGDPPPAMLPLWTALLRSSLPEDILEDVNYTVYGLGDTSYERFCYAGKMLARRMEGLGARKLGEPAWGDERAPNGIEETLLPWIQQTLDLFLPYLPTLSPDFVTEPRTKLPTSIYSLTEHSTYEDAVVPPINGLAIVDLDADPLSSASDSQAGPSRIRPNGCSVPDYWKPDSWVWATLTENARVTRNDWWQDVRDIELEFEDPSTPPYPPGSICSLQPQMSQAEVDLFLEMMELEKYADQEVHITPSLSEQPLPPHLPPSNVPTTLRSLLTNHLDLRSSPRKSFFEWMRRLTRDEREQERLDEFIEDPDEIFTYATRPSRSILETLADFRHVRIPLSHLLEILPPLRRRQFSIASSWKSHPGKVQLLIALVEYKTNLKIPRRGLCSSWLDKLPTGSRIPIKISAPTLSLPDPKIPVIFIGPGTGVAPMRAFLEERVRQGAIQNTILYFGCRSLQSDYYFSSEWEKYRSLGVKVEVAASRDQEEKIYVQDLIRRDKSIIKDWIVDHRGHVYISGSSNAMPRQVREALAWCISISGAGDMSTEEATTYVDDMFESGRGGEESW